MLPPLRARAGVPALTVKPPRPKPLSAVATWLAVYAGLMTPDTTPAAFTSVKLPVMLVLDDDVTAMTCTGETSATPPIDSTCTSGT